MADLRFTCSNCKQEIECDELWSGHQIQCPTCQTELTVPPKPDAPPHATLASAKPGQPRLSIGQSRHQRSAAPPPPPPQEVLIAQRLAQAKAGQKGSGKKWLTISAVVVIVGAAGYFGYGFFTAWQAKRAEAAQQAAAALQAATNAVPAEPANPPPPKELPVLPAVWTLDVEQAKIPAGKANGMLARTNFVVDTARLDKVGTTYLLRLLQGPVATPDLGFLIYLRPNTGDSVTGQTWTVSQEMKGKTVPQVVTIRKTNSRFQAQQKAYFSGYAMKLELGQITNGVIPGKIFLAVPPDTDQSVVAGVFKADTSIGDPAAATAANPVVTPNRRPMAGIPPGVDPSAYQQRYRGKK